MCTFMHTYMHSVWKNCVQPYYRHTFTYHNRPSLCVYSATTTHVILININNYAWQHIRPHSGWYRSLWTFLQLHKFCCHCLNQETMARAKAVEVYYWSHCKFTRYIAAHHCEAKYIIAGDITCKEVANRIKNPMIYTTALYRIICSCGESHCRA